MTPERWQIIKEVFLEAQKLPRSWLPAIRRSPCDDESASTVRALQHYRPHSRTFSPHAGRRVA